MLLLLLLSTPNIEQAQIAYMRCLSQEMDAAMRYGASAEAFAGAVNGLCPSETRDYRTAAIASLLASAPAPTDAAHAEAAARFTSADAANRAAMVSTFAQRLRLRRGPSRTAAPPVDAGQ